MLNIMYIARIFPFPLNSGEKIRDYYFIKYLSEKFHVSLVTRLITEQDICNLPLAQKICNKVIAEFIPSSNNFIKALYRVARPLFYNEPLTTGTMCFPKLGHTIFQELDNYDYDVVQIEHSPLSYYLKFIPPNYKGIKVIDLHNIETIRIKRLLKVAKRKVHKIFFKIESKRVPSYELKMLSKYDHIFTVSENDKNYIKQFLPNKPITSLPHPMEFDITEAPLNSEHKSNELLFVGTMSYLANEDAMIWFINEILPTIKKEVFDVHLTIVGRSPTNCIKKYISNSVEITGTVDFVEPYYKKASVFIVPLRAGGGARLKILEAIKYGVPVVSTSVGAEGLDLRAGIDILIADDKNKFAEAVCYLLKNPSERCNLVSNARLRMKSIHDWRLVGEKLCDSLIRTILSKNIRHLK